MLVDRRRDLLREPRHRDGALHIYYSMFGFQRVGDFIWAAGDMRARLPAGRDRRAHHARRQACSTRTAATTSWSRPRCPACRAYDPAYAHELAVIIQHGMQKMYAEGEGVFYYITVMNENYAQPALPAGSRRGIVRGGYLLRTGGRGRHARRHAPRQRHDPARGAGGRRILERDYGVPADVCSITSFSELRREALECERWNLLHPAERPRVPYVQERSTAAPRTRRWSPPPTTCAWSRTRSASGSAAPTSRSAPMASGRSDALPNCARTSRSTARFVVLAARALAGAGQIDRQTVVAAVTKLGIDPA
ncbi:MAG: hypothetical protein U1F06_00715 [Steroidobacteraceae bacterium]